MIRMKKIILKIPSQWSTCNPRWLRYRSTRRRAHCDPRSHRIAGNPAWVWAWAWADGRWGAGSQPRGVRRRTRRTPQGPCHPRRSFRGPPRLRVITQPGASAATGEDGWLQEDEGYHWLKKYVLISIILAKIMRTGRKRAALTHAKKRADGIIKAKPMKENCPLYSISADSLPSLPKIRSSCRRQVSWRTATPIRCGCSLLPPSIGMWA